MGRRWGFRLAALVLVPAACLLATELILRLVGYGYPTSFFVRETHGGRTFVGPNDRFGWRFFPPELARSPTPYRFDLAKPTNAFRIFLLGESAALGDPRPAYGFGRRLEVLLDERFPGIRFEVLPVAMTAINSHALRSAARECTSLGSDLWIVYMGNNEMAGPFGATTVLGPKAPSLAFIRATLAVRSTRLGQVVSDLLRKLRPPPASPVTWAGLGMFQEQRLPPDDPRRAVVHGHFRRNLEDILAAAKVAGTSVLLCTVASNLRDCPPFASLHGAAFELTESNRWAELLHQAAVLQAGSEPTNALGPLTQAAALDDRYAEVAYRLGLCELASGQPAAARQRFGEARDLDALPFRADAALNAAVRESAARWSTQGAQLVDIEQALAGLTADGAAPGQELFWDHVHFTFDGSDRVARLLAAEVERLLPAPLRDRARPEWADQETVERQLALTDWNRHHVAEGMLQRLLEAPFTNQLNHAPRLRMEAARLAELGARLHPRLHLETRDLYQEAIRRRPEDPRLRENYAEFLADSGSLADAVAEWRRVVDLLPRHAAAWFNLGRLQARLQQYAEAQRSFESCLALRGELDEARLELAHILFEQRRLDEALAAYQALRQRNPQDARTWRYEADVHAAAGRRDEALRCLNEAVRLRPSYWEARYLLGVELAVTNQLQEAEAEFRAVVRLRPDHQLARINLGIALVRQGRATEAREQFEEVLRLDPENKRARQHLETLDALLQQTRAAASATNLLPSAVRE